MGELASFSKGSGYSKSDLKDNGTPIILYGRLYTKYETVISEVDTFADARSGSIYSKGGEVIVPGSGETAEDISIASVVENAGVLLGGDLNIISPPEEIDSAFLAISISNGKPHKDMAKMAQGKSVVHLHNSDLEKIDLPYPSLEEQRKISGTFAKLDNLITLHQCKCIFENYYFVSWEQRKFGEVLNETREKTTVEDEDTLLSCAIDGMFLNSELFSHFRGSSNVGYLKVKKNDLILSAQNLHLGNCNVNLRFEHGIISPAYKVYELINCNPLFMQAWVKQDKTKDFFLKASTEGASVCRKNIVWEELYKQELPIPKIDEQEKIGEFFHDLDNLITLHQRSISDLDIIHFHDCFLAKVIVFAFEGFFLNDILNKVKMKKKRGFEQH